MKRRKIIYTIGLLIITALLLLTFQNSKIKGQKDYGQTNTDHTILVGEKDPNDQNNYDKIFSDIATALKKAEADYETMTTIILTKDTSLDEDITIQSGQNIKVVSKDQDVVIGVTNRGYTLSIESTISLDLQSSLSFDCNVDLKTNGSIKANFEKTGDTFFLPRLEIYDSLNALGGSLNTDYFNSINVYGTINLTAGNITSSNEEEENVALNIPLTLQGTNSGLVYTGGTLNTKIAGEGLVVTTNDTTTIDAPDTVMKIKAEVLTAESENNVELSSKTKGIYILDSTINYSLTSSLTLSDDLTLIALGDATITVGQNGYFNVSEGKTLNINGYLDGNSSSNTFYSIGANNLIIDGGITWEQNKNNGTYYFVTDSYEPGKGDAETFGRAKYSASGNTSSYPLIRVNGSGSTLNLYQNAVLQNRINTQSEGKSNNSGGAVALKGEAKDKRVNLNIIGANIRYNALPNVANSSGGAGIGAYNANIHMYSGSIDHNTVYKQAGFTEMENGQEVASTDGAGVSLIENAKLIMEDGYISYNHGSSNYNSDGAGIMVRQSSNLDIRGGEVSYNFTYGYGGGICIYNSQVDISNGRIFGNRATYGGGIASSHENSANLDDTTIRLGIAGEESNLDVTSNTAFTPTKAEGKATGYGGGVALGNDQLNNNQQLIVNDANIYNNTAIYGGGISAYTNGGDNGGRLYLRGGNISNNIAETSNNGNGIYVYSKGNDGINSLVYLSGSIKIDTSNNIVFADLDTLNNSQNDVISNDDWPKWENTNVIERDFNGLVHYKYQNLDVAKNNYHYLVINSDDRPNTSASAGYIFEITPYTDVTFHFNLIRPYDKGDSSTSFSIINKSNNTTVYTKNSLDSLGRRGLTGKWTPDSVQLMAGITYSIIASEDVAMKDISYSNATQTPIVVEDTLTATGAIGLITYADSNQYSTHSTLAAYKNGEAQEDKFIIDNANYHVLAQGKAIKIVQTETDKNYIAEVIELDDNNNKFTNLKKALEAITKSSDTNFTIQILQNVNLTKEDFITIPTGKHVTITSADENRFTLNIPPEIESDGSTIFTIENGASLTLSNIIYEGGASKNKEFVVVENNGTFTLESRAEINSNLAPDGLASIEIGRGKTTTEIAGIISKNESQYGAIFIPFSEANVNITNGAQIYDNRYTGNITGLENIGEYVDIVLESGNLNLNDLTKGSNIGVIVKQGSGSINASNLANTTPIGIKLNGSYNEQTDTYANYYRNAVAVNVTDSNTYTNKFKLIAPNNPLDSLIKEEVGSDLILNMVLAVEISFSNAWNANEDKTGYIKGETVDVVSDAYDSFTDIKNIIKKLFNVDVNEDNYTNYLTVKVKEDTIIFYIDSTKQLQFSRFTEITSRASYYLNGFVQYEKSADTSNTYYGTSSYISVQNFSQTTNHINLGTVWEPNSYVFEFNAGGLSTALGEMENQTIYHNNFDDSTKYPNIDTNLYYAIGFYFKGWKVKAKTGFVQENREDLVIADGDQITPSMLSSITSQADGDTSFVFEAQWVSIFGDNNNDGFANISNVGTSSNNPFIIRDVEGLNVLADTISNDSDSYMVDGYNYYTNITNITEENKVVNKGYEPNSYTGYYFKLADDFDNANNLFTNVIGTIDYLGDKYFDNPENKDPIYSDILNTQENHPFSGYFDGNKKTIHVNINPATNKDFVGLFGYTKNATITNLNIAGSVSGRVSVGGLVGLAYGGKISNIESDVNVSFTGINAGGIVGTYYIESKNYRNGEVRHVINRGEVKYTPSDNDKKETEVSFGSTWTEDKLMIAYQGTRAGGIIGQSFHVQLTEAYNSGNVTARFGVGGIIGTMISQDDDISQDSVVNTAFNVGDVEATSGLGTSYYYNNDPSEKVYQVNAYVGGIVGRMYGASTLSNSMNVGNVTASWRGTYNASDPNDVKFTYSTTNPTVGGRGAGGIIGVTSIEIETLKGGNKYISSVINTGKVKAWSHVGGIAGILAYSDVSYSINVGVVEADGYITYKEGNYAFTGAIVGLGVAANLSATVAFDGDLSYKTQTDSIIQAIGDDGDESVVFGYSTNSSLAAKLSSSHLICQPNNSKPYGLSSTFFDTGWDWQSNDASDGETQNYYYPQLKSFTDSSAELYYKGERKSVSEISEDAVMLRFLYKDEDGNVTEKPVTNQHDITVILELMNGIINNASIETTEDGKEIKYIVTSDGAKFVYYEGENVWKATVSYKDYQQQNSKLILDNIADNMTYEGYDFAGWYLDQDYTEPPFDGYVSSAKEQVLYAKWVPHQYDINLTGVVLYANGNVELSDNKDIFYTIEDVLDVNSDPIKLPTIKANSAYDFAYWTTTINTTGGTKTYNAQSFKIIKLDNSNYQITFYNNDTETTAEITQLQEFDFELVCTPHDYELSFTFKDYSDPDNPKDLDDVTNDNLVPDPEKTNVIYDEVENKYKYYFNINTTDTLKTPSKTGYKPIGWYYDNQKVENISDILKILNKDGINMHNVTIEGRLETLPYELRINLNGGTFANAASDTVTINVDDIDYKLERNNEGVWVMEFRFGDDITWLNSLPVAAVKSPAGRTFNKLSSNVDSLAAIVGNMPAYPLTVYAYYEITTYKIPLYVKPDKDSETFNLSFIETDFKISNLLSFDNGNLYLTAEYGSDLSTILSTLQEILEKRNQTKHHFNGYEAKYTLGGNDYSFNYQNVRIPDKYNDVSISFIYSLDTYIIDFYDSKGTHITSFESSDTNLNWLKDNNKIDVSELNKALDGILVSYDIPTGYYTENNYIITVNNVLVGDNISSVDVDVNGYTVIEIKLLPNVYEVIFNTAGENVTEKVMLKYDEAITKLPISTRPGYDFVGWEFNGSLLVDGTVLNKEILEGFDPNGTNIKLKARYKEATYEITYKFVSQDNQYWNGTIANYVEEITYSDDKKIDLNQDKFGTILEGYGFISAEYPDLSNNTINDRFLKSLREERSITITINIEIVKIYIIFSAEAGHFVFIADDITNGFYLTEFNDFNDLYDESKHITTNIVEDEKLKYLVVKANYYQRAVDALHDRPIRDGYTYSGYISRDSSINMNDPLTNKENIFEAQYSADTHNITYIGEGVETKTIVARYDETIILDNTVTRTGYNLQGWKIVGSTNDTTYRGEYKVQGDVVFEAFWEENKYDLTLEEVATEYQDKVLKILKDILNDPPSTWPTNNIFSIPYDTNLQALNGIRLVDENILLTWQVKGTTVDYVFGTMPASPLSLVAVTDKRTNITITAIVKDEINGEEIITYTLNAFKQENSDKYKIETIPEFNNEGYTLFDINSVIWFKNDENIGDFNNAEFTVNDNGITITAKAMPEDYKITYVTYIDDKETEKTITGYYGRTIINTLSEVETNPIRSGYEFDCWAINNISVNDTKITSDMEIEAKWTPVTYYIEYKCEDKHILKTDAIEYDTEIKQLPKFADLNTTLNENYYIMNFMFNGSSWEDIFGQDLRMVDLAALYNKYPDLVTRSNDEYTIRIDIVLDPRPFTINFVGTSDNVNVSNFKEFHVPFNIKADFNAITKEINDYLENIKTSYNELKHYEIKSFGGINCDTNYDFNTLIALFTGNVDKVDVRIECEPKTYYLVYGEQEKDFNCEIPNVSLNEFKPTHENEDHYSFVGWYITDENDVYTNTIPTEVLLDYITDGKVTLNAKYEPNKYSVIFYDGGNVEVLQISYGKSYKDVREEAKDILVGNHKSGYELVGWFAGEIDLLDENNNDKIIDGPILFEAKYEKIQYTIIYDSEEIKVDIDDFVDGFKLKENKKLGYTYDGWSLSNGTPIKEIESFTAFLTLIGESRELHLTATLGTLIQYKINLDTNGGIYEGTEPTNITYNINDKDQELNWQVKKTGYGFVGWSYNGNVYKTVGDLIAAIDVFNVSSTNPVCEVELVAKFTNKEVIINYNVDSNYGSLKKQQDTTTDSYIKLPNVTANQGYKFLYWEYNDKLYSANQIVEIASLYGTDDTLNEFTFNAIFSYEVTFNPNFTLDGENSQNHKVEIIVGNTTVLPVPMFEREFYTFLGWSTDPNNSDNLLKPGESYPPSQENISTTLYAIWEANRYNVVIKDSDNNTIFERTYEYDKGLERNIIVEQISQEKPGYSKEFTLKYLKDGKYVELNGDILAENGIGDYELLITLDPLPYSYNIKITNLPTDLKTLETLKDKFKNLINGNNIVFECVETQEKEQELEGQFNITLNNAAFEPYFFIRYSADYSENDNALAQLQEIFKDPITYISGTDTYLLDVNVDGKWNPKEQDTIVPEAFAISEMKVSFAIIISDGNENPKYTIGTSLGSTTLNADNKKIDSEFANSLANGCSISGYKWDNKWYTYNNDILDEFDFGQELNSSTTIYALYKPISLSIKYEDTSGIGSGKYELPTEVTNVIYNPNTPFGEMTPIYGYEFLGWSVKNDAAVEIPASSNKLEDLLPYLDSNNSVTLYPVFRLYTLTVSFDKGHEDAVGSMSNQTYNYESNLGNNLLPELPVMIFAYEGHKFAYWQATLDQATYNIGGSDDQTEELISAIEEALKNNDAEMVVKAIWEGATYNITYVNANLKAEYVDKYSSYIYDSTDETYEFSLPQANELEIFKGYEFAGWYTNSDLKGEPFVFNTNTKGDLILYAKWIANSYTISFDDNVDNEELGTMTNIPATFNQQITLSEVEFTRPGYTFVGWSLDKDAITANYLDQATITDNFGKDNISKDALITLYAVWQENKYNIIYQVNGQTYKELLDQTYIYMNDYELEEYSVAPGYEFSGWYLNGSDVPANWFEESIFEYVFTATYTEIEYKINFNVDKNALKDQNNIPESKVNIKYSSNEILKYYQENELNAGYEFIGWYLNDSLIGKYLVTGADLNINKDNKEVTLVAKFNTYFTINFDTNGGEGSLKPVRITINEENLYDLTNYLPQNITKLGYALSGFTTEVNGEKLENNILEENYSVGQDVTIYLYWEPITYNIELNANGGKFSDDTETEKISYIYGNNFELDNPSKVGHKFIGWYYNDTLIDSKEALANLNLNTITLTAKYEANKYEISFDANGATEVVNNPIEFTYDENTTTQLPQDITNRFNYVGYTFIGWAESASGNAIYSIEKGWTFNNNVDNNITLYAKWEPITYKVVLDYNDNNITQNKELTLTYDEEKTLTELSVENPTRIGYEFAGWLFNGIVYQGNSELLNLATTKDAEVKFIAQWNVINYNIIFNLNNDSYFNGITSYNPNTISTYNVNNGEYSLQNPALYVNGINVYEFIGWTIGETQITAITSRILEQATKDDSGNYSLTITATWQVIEYTITFDAQNGSDKQEIKYSIEDETISDVAVPVKNYYTFDGWYVGNEKFNYVQGEYVGDIEVVANWTPITYNINYQVDGLENYSNSNATTYTYGESIDLVLLSEEGYSFNGWYSDNQYNNSLSTIDSMNIDGLDISNTTITIYGNFKAIDYTINLDGNGGTSDKNLTLEFNYDDSSEIITLPQNTYEREGYKFVGWSLEQNGVVKYKDEADVSRSELIDINILYAVWEIYSYKLTITINGVHHQFADKLQNELRTNLQQNSFVLEYVEDSNTIKITINLEYNMSLDFVDSLINSTIKEEVVTENGTDTYTFRWAEDKDKYSNMPAEDITITGAYISSAWVVSVYIADQVFNINKENSSDNKYTVTINEVNDIIKDYKVPSGYYLDSNWYADSSHNALFDFDTSYNTSVHVYGKLIPYNYIVKFDGNGAEGTMEDQEFIYGVEQQLTTNSYTKEGYTFVGWSLDKDATEASYVDKAEYTLTKAENITLYAIWQANSYTISFDGNGATSGKVNTITTSYNSIIKLPTNEDENNKFERTGYTFVGWSTSQSGEVLDNIYTMNSTNPITLYAIWQANIYKVTFDTNGLELDMAKEAHIAYGTNIFNIIPTLELPYGTSFVSWHYEINDDEEVIITKDTVYNFTSDITIYLDYVDTSYNIIYEMNGGLNNSLNKTVITAKEVNNSPFVLNDPSKTGYKFIGWFIGDKEIKEITSDILSDEMPNNGYLTISAKWEISKFTVTYKNMDGTILISKEVEYGVKTSPLADNPSLEGHIFDAWYLDGVKYDFDTPITSDITIVAMYKLTEVRTTVVVNGEEVNVVVKSIDGIGLPADTRIDIRLVNDTEDEKSIVEKLLEEVGVISRLYDIKLVDAKGTEVIPNGEVRVSITLPNEKVEDGKTYQIIHITDTLDKFTPFDSNIRNGIIEFYTTHFSYYAIVTVDKVIDYTWLWIVLGVLGLLLIQAIIVIIVKNRKYKITFISNGNIKVKDMRYKKDENVILPIPERLGYKFVGWYLDSKYTHPANIKTMPNENIILYARWKEDPITIGLVVKNKKTK